MSRIVWLGRNVLLITMCLLKFLERRQHTYILPACGINLPILYDLIM